MTICEGSVLWDWVGSGLGWGWVWGGKREMFEFGLKGDIFSLQSEARGIQSRDIILANQHLSKPVSPQKGIFQFTDIYLSISRFRGRVYFLSHISHLTFPFMLSFFKSSFLSNLVLPFQNQHFFFFFLFANAFIHVHVSKSFSFSFSSPFYKL
ncbi:hypothetical protein DFH27DRAFT_62116 [Peziza echinospora]|nr:hypothetical protein DFH27DRAFT_62116 [Peziza echinospora]